MLLWQKTFGSSGDDELQEVCMDAQGNLFGTGSTQSTVGNSSFDILVFKQDSHGNKIWSKTIGSSGQDVGVSLLINDNGNIVVLASSSSSSGIFSSNKGMEDIYLITLDSQNGALINIHGYGGSSYEVPTSFLQNEAGNYVVLGHSRSSDFDISSNLGHIDLWVFETSKNGDILWERNYGGSDEDYSADLLQSTNGNYILLGHSVSYDSDFDMRNYGDFDITLITIDRMNGDLLNSYNYGGIDADFAAGMIEMSNGNFMITGNTFSTGVDVGKHAGFSDAWTFEINQEGEIVWQDTFGGQGSEYTALITTDTDGNPVIAGTTNSNKILGNEVLGEQNIWITTISEDREFHSVRIIGSKAFDEVSSIIFTGKDEFVLAGATNGESTIVHELHGKTDGWLTKLRYESEETTDWNVQVHPNPVADLLHIKGLNTNDQLRVLSNNGIEVINAIHSEGFSGIFDVSSLPSGLYHLQIIRGAETENLKVIKL